MRTFPIGFQAEIAKRSITPLWILKCEFVSGTKYLSDSVFSVASWDGGITTESWIGKWVTLNERVGLEISSTSFTKFELTMLNDNDVSPNLDSIFWDDNNPVEAVDINLYLWFDGLNPATDPPQSLWTGSITDFKKLNEIEYQVNFSDLSGRVNKKIGYRFNFSDYPGIDRSYVGEMANIVYGEVSNVRGIGLTTGVYTNLTEDMNLSTTNANVIDNSEFAVDDYVWIKDERLQVNFISGDDLLIVERSVGVGSHGTHKTGDALIKTFGDLWVYLFAYHPVKSIDRVTLRLGSAEYLADDFGTYYTGQSGDELSGYEGLAVVAIDAFDFKSWLNTNFGATINWPEIPDFTIIINGQGYKDDASGTYTGTANALIERPDHIAKHFADTYVSVSNFTSDAGTYFDANNYKFAGILNEYLSFKENMSNFALQCRCFFRFSGGQIRFNLRQNNPGGVTSIDEDSILIKTGFKSSLLIDRSRITDIINSIAIRYAWDDLRKNFTGYTVFEDANSISDFGEKERAEAFSKFNLVSDSDMIDDIGDFYIDRYKNKNRQLKFQTTLDQVALEFGDVITVSHNDITDADGTYEIIEANISPGSLNRIDRIDFKCISIIGE